MPICAKMNLKMNHEGEWINSTSRSNLDIAVTSHLHNHNPPRAELSGCGCENMWVFPNDILLHATSWCCCVGSTVKHTETSTKLHFSLTINEKI